MADWRDLDHAERRLDDLCMFQISEYLRYRRLRQPGRKRLVAMTMRHYNLLLSAHGREIELMRWPISKCAGPDLRRWRFVEEIEGTYEDAMQRAAELQRADVPWQYRIWDCRD